MARRARQTEFRYRTWGGKRKNAGRKPKGERAGVEHRARKPFAAKFPLHVTMTMRKGVYNLRSKRGFKALAPAIYRETSDFRVCHYAIEGNHIHLLVEARGREALMSHMKGVSVRAAKRLNQMMGKRGQVIGDRYHSRILRTPSEVKNALHYLRKNAEKHYGLTGDDEYCSTASPARTWLLAQTRSGWRPIGNSS